MNRSLIFERKKNNIISINVNHSNNCCLYSLKSKDLIHIKLIYTAYYLYFSMLLFLSILKFKNLNTMF